MKKNAAIKVLEDARKFLVENNRMILENRELLSERLNENHENEENNNKKIMEIDIVLTKLKSECPPGSWD
jgi:hypothetical protein